MATDIKNIIIDNWDAAITTRGVVEYKSLLPVEAINRGIIIDDEISDYHPAGFTHKQTDAFGGDIVRFYIVGTSLSDVKNQISVLIKIADTFTGNAEYDRLYPRSQEIVWEKGSEGRPLLAHRRWCQLPVLCNKNNVNLYT